MKQIKRWLVVFTLIIGLLLGASNGVHAADEGINELLGEPAVVYGEQLSDSQKEEVKRLLEVDSDKVNEFTVTGQDIQHYIDGNLTLICIHLLKLPIKMMDMEL